MSHRSLAAPASTLGVDILLARHGDTIVTWRTDRRHDMTLARLSDGSWDFAPNHLSTGDETPARKAVSLWRAYQRDELGMKRADVRWLAKVMGIWAGAATVISGGLVWAAMTFGDSALLQSTMTGAGY